MEKKKIPYTKVEPFKERFKKSAEEHGYSGFLGYIRYFFRFLLNFYFNLLSKLVPYSGLRVKLHRMRGVKIGENVIIGSEVTIDNIYPELVEIKDGVGIAGDNLILTHSSPLEYHKKRFDSYRARVVIEENVWVTVGVIILPGVTIGEGSVITPGSVVTDNIPPNSIARGNPAEVIRKI